ncbi:hypothetical protein [Deinococcus gobiensis]|uniref:Lipoprotein n=1 Tax=Deinococcus gobiensis (strain DSM 21396 / JCM 16679 / CGMCC 1.7299 / I-0) TaxID=745776 RepID=H8GXS4_DEIGI|nr:hypothetical protein [Deinococcus gobiensis]AFD25926.1 hypothetical protein DGo_CA1999 [Deinococcus gobiensis I-0]
MKNLLLSALTVSLLALTACGGVATPATSPTSPSAPAPAPAAQTLALAVTDPVALAASGATVSLVGGDLVFLAGFKRVSIRLVLPDGTYSAQAGGAAGQALLSTLSYTAVPGMRVEIGQAFYTPVSTVVLK